MYENCYNITSGYVGIFRPPYELSNTYNSTIYCVTNTEKNVLIMIPLVPGFFIEAYNIAKGMSYNTIYLVPPAIDMIYISDIYNLWYEMVVKLGKNMKILTKLKPHNVTNDQFRSDFVVTDHFEVTNYNDNINQQISTIYFDGYEMPIARPGFDIILWDGQKRIYFANYMTERKAKRLVHDHSYDFDEIHMPFSTNTYGGLSYLALAQKCPDIIPVTYVHSLTTSEELDFCYERGIKLGRKMTDAFI